jgi:hypothetical protein
MAFRDSTDSGITRHLPDEIEIERDQSGLSAKPRRGGRCFTPSVTGADYDYIKDLVE